MSTTVVGFRPADDKWKKMYAVWSNCEAAGVAIPKSVMDFFNGEDPGDKPGMEVPLGEASKEWNSDWGQGYEVDVTKLPKDVTIIRFYNSW